MMIISNLYILLSFCTLEQNLVCYISLIQINIYTKDTFPLIRTFILSTCIHTPVQVYSPREGRVSYLDSRVLLSKALSCGRLPRKFDVHNVRGHI